MVARFEHLPLARFFFSRTGEREFSDRLARAIWAACDAWAEGGALELNVADPAHRARSVTALRLSVRRA